MSKEPIIEPTPKDPLLRQKIWDEGEHFEDYACDAGPDENGNAILQSNGCVENKIRYKDKIYLLHTDFGTPAREIYNF